VCQQPHQRKARPTARQRSGLLLAHVHSYVIGATRSGKTNYLLSQLPPGAFAFIDKHGQAAQQKVRKPYDLFIDEFQNFGTSIISTILSESGKFGLQLTLAHQFISQLDPEIKDAVLGNCSTIISFRVGAEDAPTIAKALDWGAQDLQDLPLGRARMRTLFRGGPTSTMLMETEKVELTTGRDLRRILDIRGRATHGRAGWWMR
jgi:hypothetical protein